MLMALVNLGYNFIMTNYMQIAKAMCIVDVARVCNNGKYGKICCMQHVAHVAYATRV